MKNDQDIKDRLAVLGKITASVSHELRNPLGVIRASTYVLKTLSDKKNQTVTKHIKRIENQIDICDKIVGELLDYTRDHNPEPFSCNIYDFIRTVLSDISVPADIKVNTRFNDNMPDICLMEMKMRSIIVNIIENSIDAITEKAKNDSRPIQGQIDIEMRMNDTLPVLIFRDTGIGMTDSSVEKAFEPLYTTKPAGTGLGLSIVRKMIDDHGWRVEIASRVGVGTTITLVMDPKRTINE